MRILMISLFLILGACAKQQAVEPAQEAASPDPIFKTWSGGVWPSGKFSTLSLTGMHWGTNEATAEGCQCEFQLSGWQELGALNIRFCTVDGLTTSAACTALEQDYDLAMSSTGWLHICQQGTTTCTAYY